MTRNRYCWPLSLVLSLAAADATAQTATSVQAPGGYAPVSAPCVQQRDGSCVPVNSNAPLPVTGHQEVVQIVSGNVAQAPQAVYGGVYTLMQSCADYGGGALALRYRGPDGVAMMPLVARTATDNGGGTLITLGSNAIVDVTLPTGATSCNAMLARVP